MTQACSGKFQPIMQWFYLDSLESLPEDEGAWPTAADAAPVGSRYDGQIAVFGQGFQKKLEKLKYFVVRERLYSQVLSGGAFGICLSLNHIKYNRASLSNLSYTF